MRRERDNGYVGSRQRNHAPGAAPMPILSLLTWVRNAAAALFGC
jgi:hypothetical protein